MSLSAIILAAGQGTRMRSSTPKVLHRVLGRSLAGHMVEAARAAGAGRVCVVVGHGRQEVEAELERRHGGEDLVFAHQAEQKGTGHAVLQAEEAMKGSGGRVLVLPGDVPNLGPSTLKALIETAESTSSAVTVLTTVVEDATGYGRVVRGQGGEVLRNVEHKDASAQEREIDEINTAVYLFSADFLWDNLHRLGSDNAQGEYYLPDLIKMAVDGGHGASALIAPVPEEVEGVNTRAQLARAETFARARRNEALMVEGVTMIDPAATYVDLGVTVEPDVLLEPGVRLVGESRIASGCVVGQGCVVEDTTLEAGVTLLPYCHLEGSIVRQGAKIGPFAHLRPQADIGPEAKVGNFVEVKKSTLGRGSKASHLSYIGDATVGEGCNIGAGTITCNYDGFEKHRTVLGDGVFTGSNSALVAPISLGDGAYVGAGSTISDDVEADALAIARGRQRNIAGWVTRFQASKAKKKKEE